MVTIYPVCHATSVALSAGTHKSINACVTEGAIPLQSRTPLGCTYSTSQSFENEVGAAIARTRRMLATSRHVGATRDSIHVRPPDVNEIASAQEYIRSTLTPNYMFPSRTQ